MVLQWIIAMDTDTRKVSLVGMRVIKYSLISFFYP